MRFFATLATLVAASLSVAGSALTTRQTSLAAPVFEPLWIGKFALGDGAQIQGPLGSRLMFPLVGGNFTDMDGNLVAEMLPFSAEWGINTADGEIFFPDVSIGIKFVKDGKFAFTKILGTGVPFTKSVSIMHVETDSSDWNFLNSKVLLSSAQIQTPDQGDGLSTLLITALKE